MWEIHLVKLVLTEGTALCYTVFNRQANNSFLVVVVDVVLVLKYTAALLLLLLFGGYNINNTCFDTVT